jgi:DNA-binding NarL/FixJ family response regulator
MPCVGLVSQMNNQGIRVLLVDDQPFVGAVIRTLLATERDIELHCCLKALDAMAQATQLRPAVILQDLVLPDIDGLTLVRMYRENISTAGAAVVVLSGNDDADTRARALSAGADDFLVKLPAKRDLVACIRRHAGAAASPDMPPVSPGSNDDANQTLDRSAIADLRSLGAPDFARSLIDQFIKEAESQVATLRDAQKRLDAPVVMATAHSLKGSSMTMGARKLASLCTRLEEGTVRDPSRVITKDLMSEVDREFLKVRDALAIERQEGARP